MKIPPFSLERYFAQHEFTAPYLLCSSDCESLSVGELLSLEPSARAPFEQLWLGYTESTGHPELRKAIAGFYKTIAPEQILVHAGAEEAIFSFMNVALEPGDHLIVHWPCYQSLFQIAATLGCEVTRWEADPTEGWELDPEFLKKHLKKNTRAVVLNTPHNPTGYLMPAGKFARVVDIVRGHGCLLFCDEVYRGMEYDPAQALEAGCDLYENAVSLGVMSKGFGLAGLRIGWVATRNRRIYDEMARFKDYTSICSSAPSEYLATLAIRQRHTIFQRNAPLIQHNLGLLGAFFEKNSDRFSWVRPKAGCIAFPKLKRESADSFADRMLKQAGILLGPGSHFGYDPTYFRIGFGRKSFAQAMEKWETALRHS